VTKSDQKAVSTPKNNIHADDKKSHFMSQLMLRRREKSDQIADLIESLRKIGYFRTFQVKDNAQLSSVSRTKPQERTLKHYNKARYRKIKKYYKSIQKYKTERLT